MKKKVDCLIISTGRAASTAVYSYLSEACKLNLPWNKEPHHWFSLKKLKGQYPLLDNIYVPDKEEYFNLYSNSSRAIDASCGYFYYLEEVIKNLKSSGEMPKVVFLYRDPVTRAASIFNEWRKKGLTSSSNVIEDVIKAKEQAPGYWWEYYYDNVLYMEQFELMKEYFQELLLVNFTAFSKDPASVFNVIADFVGTPIVKTIEYAPVNSSSEAKKSHKNDWIAQTCSYLPMFMQRKLNNHWVKKSSEEDKKYYAELSGHLPHSIVQYEKFRDQISEMDVLCIQR